MVFSGDYEPIFMRDPDALRKELASMREEPEQPAAPADPPREMTTDLPPRRRTRRRAPNQGPGYDR